MIVRIRKDHHRGFPPAIGIAIGGQSFHRKVIFDESCRHQTTPDGDINKLYGVGYFFSHHIDSARFGWRYSPADDKIEIFSYCYINRIRRAESLCKVKIGLLHEYRIDIFDQRYQFVVREDDGNMLAFYHQPFHHHKVFQYRLGFYFGGDAVCPHDMKITIRKR